MRLTAEQTHAVEHPARHKRIIASAGTGKTRVLVAQVGEWVSQGATPASMVAITYTRKAGEELRRRIATEHGVQLGHVGTVHGMVYLALSLACQGRYKLTPLSDDECDAVVEHVANEAHMRSAIRPKVRKLATGEILDKGGMTAAQVALAVAVRRYLDAGRMVHVGQLLERFVALLYRHDDLRAWVQSNLRTVLWDEYQDATQDQAQILDIAEPDRSLVVGDPRQAIFGFAGASDRWLWERKAETLFLSWNFRSCTRIVDAANRMKLPGPQLVAFRHAPGLVRHVDQFGRWLGIDCGLPDTHVLAGLSRPLRVLCRTNREVALVHSHLRNGGINACIVSPDFDRFEGGAWADLFLACRHLLDPECEWLRSRAVKLGIGGTRAWDLDPKRDSARRLLDCISPALCGELDDPVLDMRIVDFAAWYQRRDLEDLVPPDAGGAEVIVMTAHASKGLEFPSVLVYDVGGRMGGDWTEIEERNLLYVALTRAQEELGLCGSQAPIERLLGRC